LLAAIAICAISFSIAAALSPAFIRRYAMPACRRRDAMQPMRVHADAAFATRRRMMLQADTQTPAFHASD
jgi:hypothetical protein